MTIRRKVVLVTGAGRGLGAALALSLGPMDCELILCGRREADLVSVADKVVKLGGKRPEIVRLDLADAASIGAAVARIAALTGHLDILINNGAMWLEARQEPYAEADVMNVVNSAVTGTFLLQQALRPLMEASDSPDVLTIGSISGLPNAALQTVSVPFYAAKRAQVALAEGWRQEFRGSNFRSILINPPYLEDALPGTQDWVDAGSRGSGARGTTRDVVEAALFALTRPRHISLTIELGTDDGGLFPS